MGPDMAPPQVEPRAFPLAPAARCLICVASGKQGHVCPAEGSSAIYLPLLLGSLLPQLQTRPPLVELPPLPSTSSHFSRPQGPLRSQWDIWQVSSSQVSLSTGSWHLGTAGPADWGVLARPPAHPDLTCQGPRVEFRG